MGHRKIELNAGRAGYPTVQNSCDNPMGAANQQGRPSVLGTLNDYTLDSHYGMKIESEHGSDVVRLAEMTSPSCK